MSGLLQTLVQAPGSRTLFLSRDGAITAGQIRATASAIAGELAGAERLYLFTASASLFVAGLLAASRRNLRVVCPAHLQNNYLREIGADSELIVTDCRLDHPRVIRPPFPAADEHAGGDQFGDPALVFYTSGTTGKPKPVAKKLAQLEAEAGALASLWPQGAHRVVATVSHQHIYGMLFRIFWPLLAGGVSDDLPSEYWEQVADRLAPGTTLVSSPAHLQRLPPRLSGTAPDLVFSSGAALSFAAAQAACEQFGTRPVEVLGSTETGGIAWRQQDREDCLWTPFPGVAADADGQGRLCVRSPFADADQSVCTGDLIEWEGARFRLTGRCDRVVKIDGKRVSLARVEDALLAQPMVNAAAAVDLPARAGALGAIVELDAEGRKALAERGPFRVSRDLRLALAGKLEPSERPKHWRFGAIPLDSQGKRVQELLRDVFAASSHSRLGRGTIRNVGANSATVSIELTPDMIWFEGHFPGEPVLAGVAQIHLAALWARQVWSWSAEGGNLTQVKFRRLLRPGDVVELKLMRPPDRQRLSFSFRLDETVASEGTIGEAA